MSSSENYGLNRDVQVADDVPADLVEIEGLSADAEEIPEAPQEEAVERAGQEEIMVDGGLNMGDNVEENPEEDADGYADGDALSEVSITSTATDASSDTSLPSGFLSPLYPFTVIPASFLTPLRPHPDEGSSTPAMTMDPKETADEPVVPVPPAEDPVPPVVTRAEVPAPTPAAPVTLAHERAGPSQPQDDPRFPAFAASSLLALEQDFLYMTEAFTGAVSHINAQIREIWARIRETNVMFSHVAEDILRMDCMRGIPMSEHADRVQRFYDHIASVDATIRANAPQFMPQPPPQP